MRFIHASPASASADMNMYLAYFKMGFYSMF